MLKWFIQGFPQLKLVFFLREINRKCWLYWPKSYYSFSNVSRLTNPYLEDKALLFNVDKFYRLSGKPLINSKYYELTLTIESLGCNSG